MLLVSSRSKRVANGALRDANAQIGHISSHPLCKEYAAEPVDTLSAVVLKDLTVSGRGQPVTSETRLLARNVRGLSKEPNNEARRASPVGPGLTVKVEQHGGGPTLDHLRVCWLKGGYLGNRNTIPTRSSSRGPRINSVRTT